MTGLRQAVVVSGNLLVFWFESEIIEMTIDNPNRFRVSTKFTVAKIVTSIGILLVLFSSIRGIRNNTINEESAIGMTLGTVVLIGILYYVSTRRRIDYDDIKQTLYIVDLKRQTEIEIPVENIDKILYSAIGGRGAGSYIIIYRDFHSQKQRLRLFPIPFDKSIETIKNDTRLKNPRLVTSNWSIG